LIILHRGGIGYGMGYNRIRGAGAWLGPWLVFVL
jgi:hypothetical protein